MNTTSRKQATRCFTRAAGAGGWHEDLRYRKWLNPWLQDMLAQAPSSSASTEGDDVAVAGRGDVELGACRTWIAAAASPKIFGRTAGRPYRSIPVMLRLVRAIR